MTSGEVSALAGNDAASRRTDDVRLMQISIPVQSGNSGGPVIDLDGHAVGIVVSKMELAGENEIAQNVNYAVKIAYVRTLLSELPNIGGYRSPRPATSLVGLVADLKGAVFLIISSNGGGQ
ncbi:MAG: S1C family serine protease [Pseudomonadota bacterium]|nr:S1C family serine protease [Pseudomonadota bacterium]